MPGLPQRNDNLFRNCTTTSFSACSNGSVSANGFWSKHRGDVSYNLLQKFWSDLSPQARKKLLRIDKPSLFEQARKNMYCSKCNGLLNEGFVQIMLYGKSLREGRNFGKFNTLGASKNQNNGDLCITNGCQEDVQDPSVHPWGGLTATKDEKLTLLDCYLYTQSLKGLQKVFDSARARERERELLYPDACGGEGRGWISQGIVGYGRAHGPRDSCALHNARLSVDTLVDFWTALGEETRLTLLRMKEEDFMERLMYRFDSKRFCRDCRRNVIREFKELKELKRIRKEPRCTSWFCVADTAFYYEVSHDTIRADWHHNVMDSFGTYHHFEWAIGTGEGKSDILEFENVGLSVRVQVNGLDLSGLNSCYITVRAWKLDGRCTELSVKALALKGQQCVHGRLVVGDGFVAITKGESIRRFFEHAEEAEEEEDDDSMDKDGNEMDGECSRPQKHAKSPELAREFLLDAATVIFKEQVEKAFRDGTTRQNAHSIFVSLSLKLLEERVHIACKDIITLEKQTKLLEEEEKEKREEEERKERRRAKEKEKKLRRKERLKEKEKDREKKSSQSEENHVDPPDVLEGSTPAIDKEAGCADNADPTVETTEEAISPRLKSPEFQEEHFPIQNYSDECPDSEFTNTKDGIGKFSRWRASKWPDQRQIVNKSDPRYYSDYIEGPSRSINGSNKQSRSYNAIKSSNRTGGGRFNEKLHCSNNNRVNDRYDFCSCYQHGEYRAKLEQTNTKPVCKSESVSDMSKPYYRVNYMRENQGRLKVKNTPGNNVSTRNLPHMKKVWEPMESKKKYPRSNSDSNFTLQSTFKEPEKVLDEAKGDNLNKGVDSKELENPNEGVEAGPTTTSSLSGPTDPSTGSNTSDSCSSCLSEGDSNTSSSNVQSTESSSTSDSEDAGPNLEGRESKTELCIEKKPSKDGSEPLTASDHLLPTSPTLCNSTVGMVSRPQPVLHQPLHTQNLHFPIFQPPSVGYYHQPPVSWQANPTNNLVPLPHPNHYVFASPFGYDMNGNSHFVQYGALQHMAPPLLNPNHVPVYQPMEPTNSKDHPVIPNLVGPKEVNEGNTMRVGQPGPGPIHSGPDQGQNGNFEKLQKGNTGFSLFHFGGPVALSNGSTRERVVGDLPSALRSDGTEGENACNKDAIEEYNLFAASNGIRFSFF